MKSIQAAGDQTQPAHIQSGLGDDDDDDDERMNFNVA